MKTITIEKYIKVLCITAASFPDGIKAAWQQLDAIFEKSSNRQRFGISSPDGTGEIVYKASVAELQAGEAEKFGLETFTIKSGPYITTIAVDYTKDTHNVSDAFGELLANRNIDPKGYCLEWYLNENEVRCMIGLKHEV